MHARRRVALAMLRVWGRRLTDRTQTSSREAAQQAGAGGHGAGASGFVDVWVRPAARQRSRLAWGAGTTQSP